MKKGFTIVELIIVIGIAAVIGVVALTNLGGRKAKSDLDATVSRMVALLREAQSRSTAQASSTSWGVHFEHTAGGLQLYALYAGGSWSSSNARGTYRLPAGVAYDAASLSAGSSTDVTFTQVTGKISATTTVKIYSLGTTAKSSTLQIAPSGAVTYTY